MVGAVLGPLLFILVYLGNPFGIPPAANAVLAGTLWVVIWWVTEPVHLAVTSLVPIPVFSQTGVVEVDAVTAQYAHPIVFLLLGGFMLALAVERSHLHRRLAIVFMANIGGAPARLLLGIMAVTAFLSMWISNTATAMLMLPIAVAIALAGADDIDDAPSISPGESAEDIDAPDETLSKGFGLALLLGVAFGANIGGAATLIGSPPSAIFAGIAGSQLGVDVGFVDWMIYAVPLVVVTLLVAWGCIIWLTDPSSAIDEEFARKYYAGMSAMESDERRVTLVFGLVILAWLLRPAVIEPILPALTDPVIAVIGGIGLFLVPGGPDGDDRLLSWEDAAELPWDVLLLIGGSFAVAHAFQAGGLDEVVAQSLSGLEWMSILLLIAVVVTAVMALSNLMSNTATATVFLPILVAFAPLASSPPLYLMAPAALAASFVFVLPVGTPPNAIAYGSGQLDMRQMVRVGIVINLICIPLVAFLSYLWLPVTPFG
ncbi:sodium-dependent dicarboxylate transporter [Halalkaliarchaeum desulfuricum]|uniref:Sodium-dependent dicarboxylate transporter n=1 Tax=Halalkaliarchaeum desulfuricum TaxID=2055893 RepID=A0A343TLT0_9EURY|nr:SLC13 family permease [Halalkaliarchaeum desulfuricum]AUX10052.1 sodium-dependent dicarboxylate transporter [Halalkaliarchaeum desulfuricum]